MALARSVTPAWFTATEAQIGGRWATASSLHATNEEEWTAPSVTRWAREAQPCTWQPVGEAIDDLINFGQVSSIIGEFRPEGRPANPVQHSTRDRLIADQTTTLLRSGSGPGRARTASVHANQRRTPRGVGMGMAAGQ